MSKRAKPDGSDGMRPALESLLGAIGLDGNKAGQAAQQIALQLDDRTARWGLGKILKFGQKRRKPGYAALKRRAEAHPDVAENWMRLGLKAGELGYAGKRREAFERWLQAAERAGAREDAQRARIFLGQAPQMATTRGQCNGCDQLGWLEVMSLDTWLCPNCVRKLVAVAEHQPREALMRIWRIDAKPNGTLQQAGKWMASIGGDLVSDYSQADTFLKMGALETAFTMLIGVLKRDVDAAVDAAELSLVVSKLFDPRLAQGNALEVLRPLLRNA